MSAATSSGTSADCCSSFSRRGSVPTSDSKTTTVPTFSLWTWSRSSRRPRRDAGCAAGPSSARRSSARPSGAGSSARGSPGPRDTTAAGWAAAGAGSCGREPGNRRPARPREGRRSRPGIASRRGRGPPSAARMVVHGDAPWGPRRRTGRRASYRAARGLPRAARSSAGTGVPRDREGEGLLAQPLPVGSPERLVREQDDPRRAGLAGHLDLLDDAGQGQPVGSDPRPQRLPLRHPRTAPARPGVRKMRLSGV